MILKKAHSPQICLEYLEYTTRLILLWSLKDYLIVVKGLFEISQERVDELSDFYTYSTHLLRTMLGIRVTILKRHV